MSLRQEGEYLRRAIERTGMDWRAHRRRTLTLLMNLPKMCGNTDADRLACIDTVHAWVQLLGLPLPLGCDDAYGYFSESRPIGNGRAIFRFQSRPA